jgi:alpha-L-arabinofuranosidase
VFVTPMYLVNRLYATRLGMEQLAVSVDGPTFSTSREGTQVPALDVVASRSADGRRIFLKAVNSELEQPLTVRINVRAAAVMPTAIAEHVVAESLTAVNGFATPDAVRIASRSIRAGNSFSLELPRHSVSVITLTTR